MPKYRKLSVEVTATQWLQNGDHPEDRCQLYFLPTGDSFWAEGSVVRYYRNPDVPGEVECESCGRIMHLHGWVDSGGPGQTVCPGDYIVTDDTGNVYPVHPQDFVTKYELI